MHPEIKKFWEDTGYTIRKVPGMNAYCAERTDLSPRWLNVYYGDGFLAPREIKEPTYLWLDSSEEAVWCNEKEMLKRIRLKAFC